MSIAPRTVKPVAAAPAPDPGPLASAAAVAVAANDVDPYRLMNSDLDPLVWPGEAEGITPIGAMLKVSYSIRGLDAA
jgi:hypothetical protein